MENALTHFLALLAEGCCRSEAARLAQNENVAACALHYDDLLSLGVGRSEALRLASLHLAPKAFAATGLGLTGLSY